MTMQSLNMRHSAIDAFPSITARQVGKMAVAGAAATVAFDAFGQAISPLMGFANLAPVPLATQVWQVLSGAQSEPTGHLLHYVAGLIGYPIGWTLIFAPLAAMLVPRVPTAITATLYGVALWIFAMYFMATLVAGQPLFLGFTGITWVALVGHVVFAWVYFAAMGWLGKIER